MLEAAEQAFRAKNHTLLCALMRTCAQLLGGGGGDGLSDKRFWRHRGASTGRCCRRPRMLRGGGMLCRNDVRVNALQPSQILPDFAHD